MTIDRPHHIDPRAGRCGAPRPGARLRAGVAPFLLALLAAAPLAAEPRPLDAIFVIDNSGSMQRNDPAFITRQVVRDFSAALPADARLGMVLFDRDARLVAPLAPAGEPGTREALEEALGRVDFQGQLTHSPAGIERALYELRTNGRPGARKVIVFLTDGLIDTGDAKRDAEVGRWLRETLAQASRKEGVRIFGIAFTESADVELIQTLALATDGDYYRAFHAEEIPGVLDRILERVARGPEPPTPPSAPAAVALSAAPAAAATPAVSAAAPADAASPMLPILLALAAFGVAGAAVWVQRRSRVAPLALPPVEPLERKDLPAAARRRSALLIDVTRASPNGTLPLSMKEDRLRIGRDPKNDIVIPQDTISSFHATIELRDGFFYLEDHRSTNGTSLNERRLPANQPFELKSGDRIDFARFEFRFLIPDEAPAGKTVILGGSTIGPESESSSEPLVGAPQLPAIQREPALFRECLEGHLAKIGALGEPHGRFVASAFRSERIDDLAGRAGRLLRQCAVDQRGRNEMFAHGDVLYVLCVIPDEMERAAAWFGENFGGFTELLGHFLESHNFTDHGCKVLCVVTYGRDRNAWVSVTIAPAAENPEPIDVMSVELLSEDERRALALEFSDDGQVV